MNTIVETSIRTLLGFIVLLTLSRLIGKKLLSQMTYFTYITGIALGNIAGDMVVHRDIKLIDGVTGLIIWTLLTILLEYISLKFAKARVILDGEPTIVIKKGVIMEKAIAKQRLNIDDLTMLLRNNNVFSIVEVDYAILEPNGNLSVLKKMQEEFVTKKDMNIITNERNYIPTEIIVDSKIVFQNLKELNLNLDWLQDQLKLQNIASIDEVFFAELQSDGTLYINKKQQKNN